MNQFSKQVAKKINVLGTPLKVCCTSPMTGYFRDGYCRTDEQDLGKHIVCAMITTEFLAFSKMRGNDLSTPRLPLFSGLKQGDRWCLCAERWVEAYKFGMAPNVDLEATSDAVLHYCSLDMLAEKADCTKQKNYALKLISKEVDAAEI